MEKTNTITKNEFKKSFVKHYRVGEKVVCTNNMIAEIIEYRNYKDIDVRYEDGYIIEHTKLGFDWLDLLALIILLVVVIVWAVRRHNLKSEQKDLEDQLSDLYADDSLDVEEADGEEADSSDAD